MKPKLIGAVALVAAAAVVPAASPHGGAGVDRVNAARACKALAVQMGSAFSEVYASSGACVSAWTRTAHAARHAAEKTCRAQGKRGRVLASCVSNRTRAALATRRARTPNAAQRCAAERDALGDDAFAVKYGTNENDANAFGKCVSGIVSNRPAKAESFSASLSEVAGSGASGKATFVLKGNELFVKLTASGLEPRQAHPAHIHAGSSCASSGDVLLALTPYETATGGGTLSFKGTFTVDPAKISAPTLPNLTINVHGRTLPSGGAYDPNVVVACGEIS